MNGHNFFTKNSKTVYLQGFWPKSVYLKCFGNQLKTVYLQGPHSSRPCISRPCCSLFGRQNSFVVQTTLSKLTKLTKLTIKETHGIRNFWFAWDNCEIFTLWIGNYHSLLEISPLGSQAKIHFHYTAARAYIDRLKQFSEG